MKRMARGDRGWFLLEHDNVLAADPAPGSGPIDDACSSVQLLRSAFAGATDVGAA
jgi:inosose dehydratase